MWHGTPFKRLLLDSEEREVLRKNPSHRLQRLRDIVGWDYLLAQNELCREKLVTSFSFPADRVVVTGYPRTDPIRLDYSAVDIREKYGIEEGKKLILYATTWRDYNQYTDYKDYSYLFDWHSEPGAEQEFSLLFAGHPFAKDRPAPGVKVAEGDDFQHLLMAADALITDYSSAIFDYLPLGKPFCLFAKDLELFEHSRGVYRDILHDFSPFVARSEKDALRIIRDWPALREVPMPWKYHEPDGSAAERIAELITTLQRSLPKSFAEAVPSRKQRPLTPTTSAAQPVRSATAAGTARASSRG